MKKNTMMRLAAVMLMCVLLTTSVVGGTFAKYVTSETGTDSARVAKWGVTIQANGTTFAKKYNNGPDTAGTQVVSEVKVVAPGTNGTMAKMELSGTPEVKVRVKYDATLELVGWNLYGGEEYCPIIITVGDKTYGLNSIYASDASVAVKCADITELKSKVVGAIAAYNAVYAANQDLSAAAVKTPDVSWKWPYENGNDSADTYLGNQAAIGNAPTITLTITTTVEQVD